MITLVTMLVKMTIASQTCWRASLRSTCSRVQEAHEPAAKAEEDGLRLPGDEDQQAYHADNLGLALEDDFADFELIQLRTYPSTQEPPPLKSPWTSC